MRFGNSVLLGIAIALVGIAGLDEATLQQIVAEQVQTFTLDSVTAGILDNDILQ